MPISSFNSIVRNYGTRTQARSDFTRTFLKNKCGLSGDALVRACNVVSFESTDRRPYTVLQLFRTFGFSQKHFTRIFAGGPKFLVCNPYKTLKPKLDFLLNVCNNCQTDLHRIVCASPHVLTRSLENHLVPTINLLASVLGNYQNVVTAVKTCTLLIVYRTSSFVPNVKLLQTLGVPHSWISLLITARGAPVCRPPDEFRTAVFKAKEMDFDPVCSSFVRAVLALMMCDNDLMHGIKSELFRSFGFRDDEIIYMFKKQPLCFISSADRTKRVLEFLVNRLCWSPSQIAISPNVLLYSLEKRMIPRCSVLQVLESKNVTSKKSLLTVLVMTERKFLNDFVVEHQDKVPEVMDAYQGKIVYDVYNFHSLEEKK